MLSFRCLIERERERDSWKFNSWLCKITDVASEWDAPYIEFLA